MAFRRKQEDAREAHAWRRFAAEHEELLTRAGLPQSLCESHDLFVDLLENGHIHYHEQPSWFTVRDLRPDQRDALAEMVVRYLRAGFPDPGLGTGFLTEEERDQIRRASAATQRAGHAGQKRPVRGAS